MDENEENTHRVHFEELFIFKARVMWGGWLNLREMVSLCVIHHVIVSLLWFCHCLLEGPQEVPGGCLALSAQSGMQWGPSTDSHQAEYDKDKVLQWMPSHRINKVCKFQFVWCEEGWGWREHPQVLSRSLSAVKLRRHVRRMVGSSENKWSVCVCDIYA